MNRFPCLYCGDAERPHTREHVLQEGFGTTLVLHEDVCGDCNTGRFSPLDDRLVKFVRIHLCWDHPDVRLERTMLQEDVGLYFEKPSGTWISVRIDRKHNLITPPQVIFLGENRVRFVADRDRERHYHLWLETLRRELRDPQSRKIKIDVRAKLAPPLQPALVRTGHCTYLLRAPDEETAQRLRTVIDSGQLLADWQQVGATSGKTVNPEIHLRTSWHYGDVARAIAKTALNFACVAGGPEMAGDPAFDTVRRFILRSNGDDFDRFVTFLFGDDVSADVLAFPQSIARPGHHTLLFAAHDGLPMVMVVLYQRPFAVIRLTDEPHLQLVGPYAVVTGLFDYRSRTHRILRLPENPFEFAEFMGPFLRGSPVDVR